MTTIKIGNPLTLSLSVLLILTIAACDVSKTSSDAPSPTENNDQVTTTTTENGEATQEDAQSETRRKQLDADIQAREQRNDMTGDTEERADTDLASEVRSKLEANIPRGKLTVIAKDADITVSGVVPTQTELDKIQPLAMEIKGVNTVVVKVIVSQ